MFIFVEDVNNNFLRVYCMGNEEYFQKLYLDVLGSFLKDSNHNSSMRSNNNSQWFTAAFNKGISSKVISRFLQDLSHIPLKLYCILNRKWVRNSSLKVLKIRSIFLRRYTTSPMRNISKSRLYISCGFDWYFSEDSSGLLPQRFEQYCLNNLQHYSIRNVVKRHL